jgi:hypothetical protein
MNKKTYTWVFIALVGLYLVLLLITPTDPKVLDRYDLSQSEARLLNLSIALPISAVYLSALYGFLRFRSYWFSVRKSREGEPLKHIMNGLMILAFSLPISAVLSTIFNYITLRNPDFLALATLLRSYLTLIFSFVIFMLIFRGAEQLMQTLKKKQPFALERPNVPLVIAGTSLFTWLITARPAAEAGDPATYLPPEWVVILTIVIPYMYIWTKGIMAVLKLQHYKDNVQGYVYQRAIANIAKGIGIIIFLSIILQLLTALSAILLRLDLGPLLILLYVLVALYAVGYGLVARGAKKLKLIEEV